MRLVGWDRCNDVELDATTKKWSSRRAYNNPVEKSISRAPKAA